MGSLNRRVTTLSQLYETFASGGLVVQTGKRGDGCVQLGLRSIAIALGFLEPISHARASGDPRHEFFHGVDDDIFDDGGTDRHALCTVAVRRAPVDRVVAAVRSRGADDHPGSAGGAPNDALA